MALYWSPRFIEHTPPAGHPERPERGEVFAAFAGHVRAGGGEVRAPAPATREDLERVHRSDYVDDVLATAGRSAMFDADTFTSPASCEVALLAAGAARDAARAAVAEGTAAWALVRPPGHHAESDHAMGFCLFNNVAVAAAVLRADGVERVAIVDIDVHHGNGTQAAFYEDPSVFYASTHQFPFYPGTGAASERGGGAGAGTTLNVPLEAGAADDRFVAAYTDLVVPGLEAFAPDVLLVSAGFDAHALDPLGGLRVSTRGYRDVVARLADAADRLCQGRVAFVTEGGYHLEALRACLEAAFAVVT